MAPLQIILLLLIVRLPRSLATTDAQNAYWKPLINIPPLYVVLSFLLSHLLLTLFVFYRTRVALKILNHPNASSVAVAARTDSVFQYARWTTMALTAFHLYVLGLAGTTAAYIAAVPHLRHIPLLPEIFYLAPTLISWIAFWAAAYQVESANRERTLPFRLATGMPAHPMPSLLQYLVMHVRHNFYILLPLGLATLIEELATRADPYVPHASEIGVLAAFACMLLMMPWFITHAWKTVPLVGPLRTRFDAMAHHYHLRFRNILLWKTHNAITNAAILGYLPFSRYFLMTDALVETLTDQQLEAVFAHEVGHGVHKHIWWYLIGMIAALLLSSAAVDVTLAHLPQDWLNSIGGKDRIGVVAGLILFAGFIALGFPFISHRFEHQADWFAAKHMAKHKAAHPDSLPIPAAALVAASEEDSSMTPLLASNTVTLDQYLTGNYPHAPAPGVPTAAPPAPPALAHHPGTSAAQLEKPWEVFISALDTISDLAHRSRDKKGWMHPSINHRIQLLRKLAADPLEQKVFNRRMIRARAYILVTLTLAVVLNAYSASTAPAAPQNTTTAPATHP